MTTTVLQLNKIYKSNAPLINNMVKAHSGEFRTLACYLTGAPDGNNGMEQRAAKTIYCGLDKKDVKWSNRRTVATVADIIDENQVDLVVCQFRRSIPIGVLAAMRSRRKPKAIAVLHGIVGGKVGFGRKALNFLVFKKLERIVSVSHTGVDDILALNIGLDRNKVIGIPNGLDCGPFLSEAVLERSQLFPGFSERDFVFAMVGRLAPVKNHLSVLRAMAGLAEDFPRAKLAIVGQGPLETQLKDAVQSLGLEERVTFMGFRQDVPEILKNVDSYLMPSFREGFGLALAEAMVSGVPVITSRAGGMLELVPSEDYGFLVEPSSIDSIGSAMRRMLQNHPGKSRRIAENAKQRILEYFTAERMADEYEHLYCSIVGKK